MHALVMSIVTHMDAQGKLEALVPYHGEIASAAMGSTRHSNDLCRILQKIAPPCSVRKKDPVLQALEAVLAQCNPATHRS